jgi:hypothetical protein
MESLRNVARDDGVSFDPQLPSANIPLVYSAVFRSVYHLVSFCVAIELCFVGASWFHILQT